MKSGSNVGRSIRWWRSMAAALGIGLAGMAMAIPGPELLPSPAPVVSPDGEQPNEIRVGQADDGRSVIAWVRGDRLFVQRRAADGSAFGEPEQVLQTSGDAMSGLSLAVGANGHYTIGVQASGGAPSRIFIRRYNPDGTRLLVPGEPDDGPLTVAFDDLPTCASAAQIGQSAPAVAVDAAGNTAYTFTRSAFCPTGPGGALQPDRTRLFYRYAPVAAPAADAVPLFEQSPVTSAGFRVVDTIGSAVALQDDGNGLVTWVGHPEAFQTPSTYVRPVQFGLATAAAQVIEATNSFNRDAPVIGAKTGGYVLNWRGDFNDPSSGNRRQPCYVQARALDGSAQFAVQTVPGCGRNQIVRADGRFELISSIGVNLVGRRYDANGVETGAYGGGSRPNRFLDRIASAWAPRLANGNYLAVYNVDQADFTRATLEPVRYGGPDGTRQLNLEINPTGPLTISDGRTVTLFWTSNAPAGSCFGFGNLGGPLPSSGSRVLGSFTTAGTRTYGIACGPGELRKSVTLELVDPDAVTVTASWNPPSIVSGNRATVSWNATNADSCTYELSGALADVGSGGASGAIEYAFPDPGEARFDLSCTGAGGRTGTASASITIGTPRPLTVSAAWSPTAIFAGTSATVSWISENAVACTGTFAGIRNDSGPVEASGSARFEPGNAAGSQTFTLECAGVDGEIESATASLSIAPVVPTVSASWTPTTVRSGDTATLMWSSTDAVYCEGQYSGLLGGEAFAVASSGLLPVTTPTARPGQIEFRLTCQGLGGGVATTAVTLTVNAVIPTVTASWTPTTVRSGDTATLTWSSTDAVYCEGQYSGLLGGEAFAVASSGLLPVTTPTTAAGRIEFRLTCQGLGGGVASTAVSLTVNAVIPVVSVRWAPATVRSGETATVSWTATDAVYCDGQYSGLLNRSAFAAGNSGSLTLTMPASTGAIEFRLTCQGLGGGVATTAVSLTVNAVIPVVSASWTPASVRSGETATVSWTATDAVYCDGQYSGLLNRSAFAAGNSGSLTLTMPASTGAIEFRLTCQGLGGGVATTAVSLTVNAVIPVVSASWTPASVRSGDTAKVSWTAIDAVYCDGQYTGLLSRSAFAAGSSGSLTLTMPASTGAIEFRLTCQGLGGGVATTTTTLTVSALPPPPPPPVNLGSITLTDGREVQLTSSAGAIVNTRVTARPAVLPAGFTPLTDFLAFDITNIPVGGSVEVTLTFPAGVTPNGYVKCTPDCALFDRAFINGSQVRLALTDGGPGDSDGVADGVIRDPGAPGMVATAPPPATGGGGAAGGLLPLLGVALLLRRRRFAR